MAALPLSFCPLLHKMESTPPPYDKKSDVKKFTPWIPDFLRVLVKKSQALSFPRGNKVIVYIHMTIEYIDNMTCIYTMNLKSKHRGPIRGLQETVLDNTIKIRNLRLNNKMCVSILYIMQFLICSDSWNPWGAGDPRDTVRC